MELDRRMMIKFDWETLVLALSITGLSVLLLYSLPSAGRVGIHLKQLVWLGLGLLAMGIVSWIDYQRLSRYAYVLYGSVLASLVAVLLFSPVINGAQRWLDLGGFRIQPSELAKPALMLAVAHYCAQVRGRSDGPMALQHIVVPLGLMALPFALIAKQPDLSTSMILPIILAAMLIANGMRRQVWVTLGCLAMGALPVLWFGLKDYQRLRLLTLFQPQNDLLGAGYHSWQSKIAIGSGGLWGKGLFAGTQSRLHFLPETHTDFIFAVLGEEMGLCGVLLLFALFAMLLIHGLVVAAQARDHLGSLIVTGVVVMLAAQVFLNVGMTTGIIPIIGLPLPLMSYGGSSLITTFICLGLLMSVRRHCFTFS
ncbi:rod shape-determining protein RodA [Candidatus Entotheonella palauensis]|uniref:rod shape-determining protein RodA n=1 Tax=Candidatus Entotheonella palauensis TaxID=93172 RepID=UPI000B7D28BA|nr:rod shape-determining protein RodA [Candidatus Entotheonella palauensis]